MKNLIIYSGLSLLLLSSCGSSEAAEAAIEDAKKSIEKEISIEETTKKSEVGAWTEDDIQAMYVELEKADASFEPFGDKKQDFIDCYTSEIEANYPNFATANGDLPGCQKIAMSCAEKVM